MLTKRNVTDFFFLHFSIAENVSYSAIRLSFIKKWLSIHLNDKILLFLLCLVSFSVQGNVDPQTPFLTVDQAFRFQAKIEAQQLLINVYIAPDYYLYRDRLQIQLPRQFAVNQQSNLPAATFKNDPYFGHVAIFAHSFSLKIPLKKIPTPSLVITINYQGCANQGLCYPPSQKIFLLKSNTLTLTPELNNSISSPHSLFAASLAHNELPLFSPQKPFIALAVMFLAGIGLAFTPCVLPVLPVLALLISRRSRNRKQVILYSFSYVVGISFAYALLGGLFSWLGYGFNLPAYLQLPIVTGFFALILVLLALWNYYSPHLSYFNSSNQFIYQIQAKLQHFSGWGFFAAGAISCLVISPCTSAPLVGIFTYLAIASLPFWGAILLATLGLAMGLPLLIITVFGTTILQKKGPWLEHSRFIFSWFLIGLAWWLLRSWLAGAIMLLGYGVLLIFIGLVFISQKTSAIWLRTLALVALLWGSACILGAAMNNSQFSRPLAFHTKNPIAQNSLFSQTFTALKPLQYALQHTSQAHVLLLVSADWCISCHEIEQVLANNPQLHNHAAFWRFDITHFNHEAKQFLEKYQLIGPPALLFFRQQNEIDNLRLNGVTDLQKIQQNLVKLLQDY